jgi:hypothetical protein
MTAIYLEKKTIETIHGIEKVGGHHPLVDHRIKMYLELGPLFEKKEKSQGKI